MQAKPASLTLVPSLMWKPMATQMSGMPLNDMPCEKNMDDSAGRSRLGSRGQKVREPSAPPYLLHRVLSSSRALHALNTPATPQTPVTPHTPCTRCTPLHALLALTSRDAPQAYMLQLAIVWISHMHADHHLGLLQCRVLQ